MATKSFALKNALIAFYHIIGSHSRKCLAEALVHILDRAGITSQVSNYYYYYSVARVNTEAILDRTLYPGQRIQ